MAEKGIDIAAEQPKRWTTDMLEAVNVVITMDVATPARSCPDAATRNGFYPTRLGNRLTRYDRSATKLKSGCKSC